MKCRLLHIRFWFWLWFICIRRVFLRLSLISIINYYRLRCIWYFDVSISISENNLNIFFGSANQVYLNKFKSIVIDGRDFTHTHTHIHMYTWFIDRPWGGASVSYWIYKYSHIFTNTHTHSLDIHMINCKLHVDLRELRLKVDKSKYRLGSHDRSNANKLSE